MLITCGSIQNGPGVFGEGVSTLVNTKFSTHRNVDTPGQDLVSMSGSYMRTA